MRTDAEPGDGSERCTVCDWRCAGESFYVWLPGPYPVCSPEHAARWRGVHRDPTVA